MTKEPLIDSTPLTLTGPRTAEAAARADSAILGQLTRLINTPEFSTVEAGDDGKFAPPEAGDLVTDPIPVGASTIRRGPAPIIPAPRPVLAPRPQPAAAAGRILFGDRVFTTGRLGAGKDSFLSLLGAKIHGFADPLYALQRLFFGTTDKTLPGARSFLQIVGQWGRGTVTEKYPLTPERAIFNSLIRATGQESVGMSVVWSSYGIRDDIWVKALLDRVLHPEYGTATAKGRVGVSNVRFDNELTALRDAGFAHFHVMCSQRTLAARHVKGLVTAAQANDISEQLALNLDRSTMAAVKSSPTGPKLRAVWMDETEPAPSPRFITRAEVIAAAAA